MSEKPTIRELRHLEEMAGIYPLFLQSNPLDETTFRARLAAMVAQGNYRCVAAFIADHMVGVAGFWTGTQLWCGKYVEADHLVVDETLRSRGIGAALMDWIEQEAERAECHVIRIAMILGRDRTHQFYRRLGYFDDGLLMVKALSRGAAAFPEYVAQPT